MAKKCTKCGMSFDDSAQFCPDCGTGLSPNGNKTKLIITVVLAVIFGSFGIYQYQQYQLETERVAIMAQQQKEKAEQEAADQKNMEQMIELAKEGKWQECIARLEYFKNQPADAQYIAAWGKAQIAFGQNNFEAAAAELNILPNEYQGAFAKEILEMKNNIIPQKIAETKRAAYIQEMADKGYVWVSNADGKDTFVMNVARMNPGGTTAMVEVYNSDGVKEIYQFMNSGLSYSIDGSGISKVGADDDGRHGKVADNPLAKDIWDYAQPIVRQQVEEYQRKHSRIKY